MYELSACLLLVRRPAEQPPEKVFPGRAEITHSDKLGSWLKLASTNKHHSSTTHKSTPWEVFMGRSSVESPMLYSVL